MGCGEYLAYIGKYSRIGGDIRVGCFSDRGLVDDDSLIDIFESFDAAMLADGVCRSIEVILECDREDVDDE